MNNREALFIFIRYFLLIILALGNFFLIYWIFTPLTIGFVWNVMVQAYPNSNIFEEVISLEGLEVYLIPACIAGAAYYSLFILNFTTPMKCDKRIKSLIFMICTFFFLNTLRIIVFIELLLKGGNYFEILHSAIWNFGSTLMILIIWFANIKLFKISSLPFYSDFISIKKELKK